jgi:thiol-disulfide isomerase/thioredoxin
MTSYIPGDKFEEVFNPLVEQKKKAVFLFTSEKNQDG